MCYRDSRGVVPPAGIRHGRMIVNSAGRHVVWLTTEIYDMPVNHWPVTTSYVVRWCSTAELTPLRSVRPSCRRQVLAPARTCLRQVPPTSRGRGLATSAVMHHLADDMSIKAFTRGKRCKISPFFLPRFVHNSATEGTTPLIRVILNQKGGHVTRTGRIITNTEIIFESDFINIFFLVWSPYYKCLM